MNSLCLKPLIAEVCVTLLKNENVWHLQARVFSWFTATSWSLPDIIVILNCISIVGSISSFKNVQNLWRLVDLVFSCCTATFWSLPDIIVILSHISILGSICSFKNVHIIVTWWPLWARNLFISKVYVTLLKNQIVWHLQVRVFLGLLLFLGVCQTLSLFWVTIQSLVDFTTTGAFRVS